ncbi:hypothetical protein MNBD_GAMMA18-639 [hydrothermal vent metagenome]|uniref:Uncharacterized protein n=1 Tax=hydrothermal vent metagenome TaxID=652676 RepID=A0A3B1AB41_9ZZZZ
MIEKPDPDTDVGYEGIAGASCQFTGVRDVEFIKIPLLLVFLPALSRQVFVA